ncbi:MAG: hypothetical protein LAP85_03135 [Acidobacteriia bacterium]|nr:hypothetical protein [Terriglobia bacterium]
MERNIGSRRSTKPVVLALVVLFGLMASSTGAMQNSQRKQPPDPRVTTPKAFFGYNIGDDYKLTPWLSRELAGEGPRKGIVDYDRELQRTSNRVRVFSNGTSEMGRPLMLTVITAPENWAQIDKFKAINKKMADPRQVASDDEARLLAQQGKAVYWLDAGIHATERTGAETLTQLSYELASGRDEWTLSLLKDVIVVIEGTINPDGLEIVTDWYYTYKDTPFVSSSPPYYNKYNGHDDNRDFIRLSLKESQASTQARFEWNPLMYTDLHQAQDLLYLGMSPDPSNFAENPISNAELGSMSFYVISQMIAAGYKGVFTYDYADMWDPSYNHMYTMMHNANGSWWELTGASYATPRTITGGSHANRRTWFNPQPYTVPLQWRLIDAVNLQKDAIKNSLTWMMRNKNDLLFNFYLKGKNNMAKASGEPPTAFVIPAKGGNNVNVTDLINTLHVAQHIEVDRAAAAFTVDGQQFAAGDYVVRMNQPYGLYAKLLLTRQDFPINALDPRNRTTTYDMQAWTLGLMSDVKVAALTSPLPADLSLTPLSGKLPYAGTLAGVVAAYYAVEHQASNGWAVALPRLWQDPDMSVSQADASFTAAGHTFRAGDFVVHTKGTQADHDKLKALVQETGLTAYAISGEVPSVALHAVKVGLLKPNGSTMPEGWTRLRLDRAAFPYTSLSVTDISSGNLAGYNVVIIPSVSANGLINGSSGGNTPPEYRAGIGAAGVANLKSFAEKGGTLVLMGQATTLPITQGWDIGVSQATVQRPVCKGSIVRIRVDPTSKVGYGYDVEEACWFLDSGTPILMKTPGSRAQVVAAYTERGDLLLSGYIGGGDVLRGMAAIVEAPLGAGRIILLAPDVLYRSESTGDFMFFWNSLIAGAR